jgi:hypothetical protein
MRSPPVLFCAFLHRSAADHADSLLVRRHTQTLLASCLSDTTIRRKIIAAQMFGGADRAFAVLAAAINWSRREALFFRRWSPSPSWPPACWSAVLSAVLADYLATLDHGARHGKRSALRRFTVPFLPSPAPEEWHVLATEVLHR